MESARAWNERGFILATALIAMVVVGAAVVAGYFVANQEYRIGKSTRQAMTAFYAAHAGLERELAAWGPVTTRRRFTTLSGGEAEAVGPVPLQNGGQYFGTVTRIDNTPLSQPNLERYYLVQMVGRDTSSALRGEEVRNRQAMIVRVRYFDFCCSAALTSTDTINQEGTSTITGNNTVPDWGATCDSASTENLAGVEVPDSSMYTKTTNATLDGEPGVEEDTTLERATIPSGEEGTWDLLRAKATATYTYDPGVTLTGVNPVAASFPATGCDTSKPKNWGEPTPNDLAANPPPVLQCVDHFPILYGKGDLTVEGGPGRGQGILIVDGNLTLRGAFSFYGIVLVEGSLTMEGNQGGAPGKVIGSVVVRGEGADSTRIAGSASIQYSACAVQRAKELANLSRVEPLPLRSWAEALY